MTCEELSQLLPDLLDGTLILPDFEEALVALTRCPECQKEFEAARQVRDLLLKLRAADTQFQPSPCFKAKLLVRIHQHDRGFNLSNLSEAEIKLWVCLINKEV